LYNSGKIKLFRFVLRLSEWETLVSGGFGLKLPAEIGSFIPPLTRMTACNRAQAGNTANSVLNTFADWIFFGNVMD
jgi:hypothetical protein